MNKIILVKDKNGNIKEVKHLIEVILSDEDTLIIADVQVYYKTPKNQKITNININF